MAKPSQWAQFHGVGKNRIEARIATPAPICTTKSHAKFGSVLFTATILLVLSKLMIGLVTRLVFACAQSKE